MWPRKSRREILPDVQEKEVKEFSEIDEISGKLKRDSVSDKLMSSVMESDEEKIDEGKLIREAINQGLGSFTPDIMFENLVKNYQNAKRIYGPRLISLLSGYNDSYVERNIKIPEFQRELKKKLEEGIENMKKDKLLDKEGTILEGGIELAALTLYMEELDNIVPKGNFGERIHKKISHYGEKQGTRSYRKGDRYKDFALKKSIKTALRRGHSELHKGDLKTFERMSRGKTYIVYALDASGSMRGKKIDAAKKAGVALAFRAIDNKDKVGLITFGSEIKDVIAPTNDFGLILKEITKVKASKETDFVATLEKAIEIFPDEGVTKHIILLSDALPTVGDDPEEKTLNAVSSARSANISVSLIGIGLDKKGEKFGRRIVEVGNGKFYICRNLDNLDKIMLEDYYDYA